MSFKTDYGRVNGLGSAKEGAHHWWAHQISSVALIPLSILFICTFAAALGGGYDAVIATYQHPLKALIAILFIATAFLHLKQGLQVLIEDYVHSKSMLTVLLMGTTLFCWAFGAAGVFAVAKIAFSA